MLFVTTALSGLMAGAIQTAPAPQQPSAAPTQDAYDLGTVVVSTPRPRGSVNSDIPPDVTLSAEEIQAYGASNIEELLTFLEPITRSSRGRADGPPIMLVNGRRTSGFREIRGIPSEAIERIETFPEEVALQYGYRADQRVVNFVLKAEFRSLTAELQGRVPTRGGRTTTEIETNVLRISGGNRWSMELDHERSTPLFESERDLIRDPGSTPYDLIGNVSGLPFGAEIDPALSAGVGSTVRIIPVPQGSGPFALGDFAAAAGDPRTGDLGAWRTLMGQNEKTTLEGSFKHDLNGTTQATISGSLENSTSHSFNGLPGLALTLPGASPFSPFAGDVAVHRYLDAPRALDRDTDRLTGELGVVVDGFLGDDWRWTLNGSYNRVQSDTRTGRGFDETPFQARLSAGDLAADPFAPLDPADFTRRPDDTAESLSQVLGAELVLNGDVYDLPAGGVTSTFKVGADTRSLDSTSLRSGVVVERSQSRDRISGQASFDLPVASRDKEVLAGLGDLSFNLNFGFEELSDFGGLPTLGFNANWSPIEPLSLLVSYTAEQGAPSVSQLNDPVISTPNTPVFDFATGQTVLVTRVDGGNAGLDADDRQVWKVGATLRPFSETNLSLSSTWTFSRTDDYIAAFPTLTPDLEAALPGRFTRDVAGNLVAFDARPLNFERFERQDIRTGFRFSRAFGRPTPPPAPAEGAAPGGPGARRPGGGSGRVVLGGGGGGHGGRRGASMQPGQGMFNLSIYHTWRLQDEIVIADGLPVLDLLDGAATGGRGGSPRHEIQLHAGVFRNGMGAFLRGDWRASTRVDGGSGPDLEFADQTTLNLNVFMDLGGQEDWVARFPWLEGSRLNLGVHNLFASRPEVTSGAGDVPLNYQPDYLDPEGRTISLTFRKILF